MTVAIMQPYLFPYMGYWQLIANTDEFVFFDVVQYNKKSWMNRNRILHPTVPEDFLYISVPIKQHSRGTLIADVLINNEENWKNDILGKLTFYKKMKAPYYEDVLSLLNEIFSIEYSTFMDLIVKTTQVICKYLDMQLKYHIASTIDFDKEMIKEPGDWALSICNSMNAQNYINPYGGYEIFDENKYNQNGVDIKFLKSKLTPYQQSWRKEFMPGLSIIDVMMFNSKEKIKEMLLNDYDLLTKQQLIGEI